MRKSYLYQAWQIIGHKKKCKVPAQGEKQVTYFKKGQKQESETSKNSPTFPAFRNTSFARGPKSCPGIIF